MRVRVVALIPLLLATLWTSAASAQTVGSSTIIGKVSDESGAVMPGVAVTLTSPALQVPQLMATSDLEGAYRFVDLRPGNYTIKYELQGFQTIVRDDVRLNAGFTARIDVTLQVGTLAETLTITGRGPVVDVATTAAATNFTKETLDNAPVVMTMWQVLAMTPGIRSTSMPDVGGSTVGTQQGYSNYGTSGQVKPQLEGIDTREDTTAAGTYYDDRAAEEVQVRGVGNDAEMALPGTNYISIVKSGGNEFHGSYFGAYEDKTFQRTNIDDGLRALGVGQGSPIEHFWDASGDLGGRIIRDKLWFYGAYRNQRVINAVAGFADDPGPDQRYGTTDDRFANQLNGLINYTGKVSYQPNKKFKAIAFAEAVRKTLPNRGGTRYRPAENSWDFFFPTLTWKGEIQGTPTDNLLWNVMVGRHWQSGMYDQQAFADKPGNPTRYNRVTQIYTGPCQDCYHRTQFRWQSSGSISWFPNDFIGGRHSMKTGYRVTDEWYGIERGNKKSGNYMLTFDNVGGLLQGVELQTQNSPIVGLGSRMTEVSAFVMDTWRVGDRVTLNPGFRFERYHSFVSPQTKIQGTFGEGGDFPGVDIVTWTSWAPRFGIAYDLTGHGTTVLKGTAGWYNHTMGSDYASDYNRNFLVTTNYRWRDLNGNNDYDPGEANLDINGPDFISVTGATNNINNPGLSQPRTYEYTADIDRELMANFSARLLYVYKNVSDLFSFANALRPYDAWSIPITRTDPGPDGALGTRDDRGPVTFVDYTKAFSGAAFVGNQQVTRPAGRNDRFQTIELTLNKRPSHGWDMLASFSATKNHAWISGTGNTNAANPSSPNDAVFPIDETWNWQFKVVGGCELPYRIRVGTFYQLLSGVPSERSYVFRRADPEGGTSIAQANTVTLRLEPRGSVRMPNVAVVNLKVSRKFDLGHSRSVALEADIFNALNANTLSTISYVEGPTFGQPRELLPPMVARFGASFRF